MSETIYLLYAFIGSFSFGLTAILLKIGMEKPNIFQGMAIRGLGSVPILILWNIYSNGLGFYKVYTQFEILILVLTTSTLLLLADVFLLHILSKKPVGVITPIIAINPVFTTLLLLVTDEAVVTSKIIALTIVIVFGVFLVTFKSNNGGLSLKSFDIEALRYGIAIAIIWGVMNYLDILVLSNDKVEGISYSAIKFTIVSIMSLSILAIHHFDESESDPISIRSKSFRYMLIAGFIGWVAGSVLVYTSYERGNTAQIIPIVGLNPLFAIILSIILRQEIITKLKLLGILLCVSSSILLVL
ncbi:MAG: hypothetical protein HeimC2_24240 [Candidatus Heimdallarchaeota archaeon LC_2]|nr:MAG: hypothetical protein HeimC2_24240 [Candidatus Heimdallarchaeota archaeon LC_2]